MREITNPRTLYAKAALFIVLGTASAALIVIRTPLASTVVLLAIAIWAFARVYYFAFYVIERYVDPTFRFSGLWSCALYLWRKRPRAS